MHPKFQKPSLNPRSAAAMLAALAFFLLLTAAAQRSQLNAAQAQASAVLQKAFYETCELTQSMSVNLRKLLVAGESGQMQQLLNQITRQAQGASGNLALLPMGEEAVAATLKFINQVGDYSEVLSVRLADGGALRAEDYQNLSVLSENAAAFSSGMGQLTDRLEKGEPLSDSASGAESLYPLSRPAADYPTLLYDGPFSDGVSDGNFKSLTPLKDVTADEARQNLMAFLGNAEDIRLTGEGEAPVPCYEFSLISHGYPLTASVTRQGGRVLYILCGADIPEGGFTAEQLLDKAQNFLHSRGFGDMEMSYFSAFEGILTANFAPVQGGIILYPDLIKLQFSMKDGALVGMEAAHYLMNHVPRSLPAPLLTEDEALARLGETLTAESVRLSVIPVNLGEALCYEIHATDGADNFLVYIDAVTGAERELMQVVSDAGGALVM